MKIERMYHLIAFYPSGEKVYCTSQPMTHEKCIIMRSKFSNPNDIILEEVGRPIDAAPFKINTKQKRTISTGIRATKKGCWIEGHKIACYST